MNLTDSPKQEQSAPIFLVPSLKLVSSARNFNKTTSTLIIDIKHQGHEVWLNLLRHLKPFYLSTRASHVKKKKKKLIALEITLQSQTATAHN